MDLFTPSRRESPAVAALRANLARLPAKDQDFARSLLQSAAGRGLSAKQAACVDRLNARASAPAAPVTYGLERIVDIMGEAARRLKWPVIRFEAGGRKYRLGRCGPAAREPGAVNVTSDEKGFEARTYFGRIDLLGTFEPHPSHDFETGTAIGIALLAFAADPVEQARIYGQRFGCCCFCGLELTDRRSVKAGYGPICADKFGLCWGE